ncbi:hypothetical protein FQ775_17125 [Nitratireductor mangrovi]|uniref:Uncharacterized protein n=1 Tax=Nitratireductor mangrovi TaxID=2599600 RepID=A0A5B8L2W1_9HYPH|nr:hypothetical protein [Nitratireductor mangrovi]QDZ01960.1 hypothetical protein FQ775_17125 [Nitratireductor mangrovi]
MVSKGDEEATERGEPDGKSWWLYGAAAATVIFLAVAAIIVGPVDWQLWARLRNLSLNELGDFLAGLFAPLAFVWLAAAVGIQAQELKSQRRELRLTRKEFEQSRTVAEETRREIAQQAEAARKNAEFVGRQTEILGHQLDRQVTQAADEELSEMLSQLETFLRARFMRNAAFKRHERTYHFLTDGVPAVRNDFLAASSATIIGGTILSEEFRSGLLAIDNSTLALFEELSAILQSIADLRGNASASTSTFLNTMRFDDLLKAVDAVLGRRGASP